MEHTGQRTKVPVFANLTVTPGNGIHRYTEPPAASREWREVPKRPARVRPTSTPYHPLAHPPSPVTPKPKHPNRQPAGRQGVHKVNSGECTKLTVVSCVGRVETGRAMEMSNRAKQNK